MFHTPACRMVSYLEFSTKPSTYTDCCTCNLDRQLTHTHVPLPLPSLAAGIQRRRHALNAGRNPEGSNVVEDAQSLSPAQRVRHVHEASRIGLAGHGHPFLLLPAAATPVGRSASSITTTALLTLSNALFPPCCVFPMSTPRLLPLRLGELPEDSLPSAKLWETLDSSHERSRSRKRLCGHPFLLRTSCKLEGRPVWGLVFRPSRCCPYSCASPFDPPPDDAALKLRTAIFPHVVAAAAGPIRFLQAEASNRGSVGDSQTSAFSFGWAAACYS